MPPELSFEAARAGRLYLQAQPIIDVESRIDPDSVSRYGLRKGNLPDRVTAKGYEIDLSSRIQEEMAVLAEARGMQVKHGALCGYARTVAHNILRQRPASLTLLSERGILPHESISLIPEYRPFDTRPVTEASLDMILEYQNAKLPFTHQLMMLRRFLPLSYLEIMLSTNIASRQVAMTDVLYIIQKRTFPHSELEHMVNMASSLAEKYEISMTDAVWFARCFRKDPENALMKALDKGKRLSGKYNVSISDAMYSVIHNPKGPEGALKRAMERAKKLLNNYDVSDHDAMLYALRYPKDPEAALKKAMRTAKELSIKHDISISEAMYLAMNNPNDPDAAIIKAMGTAKELMAKHAVSKSEAMHCAINNPKDPKGFLIKAMGTARQLSAKYHISNYYAMFFATRYPIDPENVLKKALETAKQLSAKYDISITYAMWFIKHYPKDPESALKKARKDGRA